MIPLFNGIFWGLFFIIIGVLIIARRYIPFQIPLGRVIVALLFIYVGIWFLLIGPGFRDKNTIVFTSSQLEYSGASDQHDDGYNIIFSSGDIDLTGLAPSGGDVNKEVNVVFGSGNLRINPSVPVRVEMSSAFGSISTPNGSAESFGDRVYTTPVYREGEPAVRIKATAVFGSLNIRN
jgi:hypothetical protein